MWIKFTPDYLAGSFSGAGLAIFLLGIGARRDLVSVDYLTNSGCLFAGLALLLAGGGMKLRSQARTDSSQTGT